MSGADFLGLLHAKNWFPPVRRILLFFGSAALALAANQPAMIGQGTGSVAMQLHYPPKEKAAKKEGIVQFYCEVSTEGKPGHISTLYGNGQGRFGAAVDYALYHGRFSPARVEGKPTAVMVGGTVLFVLSKRAANDRRQSGHGGKRQDRHHVQTTSSRR